MRTYTFCYKFMNHLLTTQYIGTLKRYLKASSIYCSNEFCDTLVLKYVLTFAESSLGNRVIVLRTQLHECIIT